MWFTVVDSRGRIRWTEKHPDWDVLVLVCRSTPADYLDTCDGSASVICLAGHDRVDLRRALVAMATRLRVRCVLSMAGGGLSGALLRAGLIDVRSLWSRRSLEAWERRQCWTGRRWPSVTGRRRCSCCRCIPTWAVPSDSVTWSYPDVRPPRMLAGQACERGTLPP